MEHKYWIDDDGYMSHGTGDEYRTVTDVISKKDIEPLSVILDSHDALLAACKRDKALADAAILRTPTGNYRDKLTEINILRMQAIAQAENRANSYALALTSGFRIDVRQG